MLFPPTETFIDCELVATVILTNVLPLAAPDDVLHAAEPDKDISDTIFSELEADQIELTFPDAFFQILDWQSCNFH